MSLSLARATAALVLAALTAPAAAQDAALPAGCTLRDQSAVIRVLVCTEPLDQDALAKAGRAACAAARPCGAWVWPDPAAAPITAPANHDGLTPEQIVASLGVWVAEDEMFISIDQVAN
jgi:hypothetical protein